MTGSSVRRGPLRASVNSAAIIVAAIVLPLMMAFAIGGCRSGGASNSDDTPAPSAVTMAVSAAKAVVAPMRREIRLLGTTVATRHLQLRAPSAGRVLGFNLQNGDRVRRGQVIAHVLADHHARAT